MREIKFQGISINTKDWITGSLVYSPKEDQYYLLEHCGEELSFPVHKNTVRQFTNLHDKNGKEIYEGDIVKCTLMFETIELIYSEIVWNNGGFEIKTNGKICGALTSGVIEKGAFEVAGNIHNNPELLEVGK